MRRPIEYGWECLDALLDAGLEQIIRDHWDEVGVHKAEMPLAVDWDRYRDLEEKGILRVMGARRGEDLVGYASFIVSPGLHYRSTLHALNDAIYVEPNSGAGLGLIRSAERALAELAAPGWCRITFHLKLATLLRAEARRVTLSQVLERLGYSAFETVLDKLVRADHGHRGGDRGGGHGR